MTGDAGTPLTRKDGWIIEIWTKPRASDRSRFPRRFHPKTRNHHFISAMNPSSRARQ